MILELKKFFYFFLLSVIFHALVVFFVFLGDRERRTSERKITWVSLQSGSRVVSQVGSGSDGKKPDSASVGGEHRERVDPNKGEAVKNQKSAQKQVERKKNRVEQANIGKKKLDRQNSKKVFQARKEEKRRSFAKADRSKEKKQVVSKVQNKLSERYRAEERVSGTAKKEAKSELAEIKSGSSFVSPDEIDKRIKDLYKFYDSAGGVGGGQSQGSEDIENVKIAYMEIVSSLIRNNYIVPQFLKGTRLSCVVYISISKDGSIEDLKIEQSSGNPSFDSFVLKTIQNSVPFPNPPGNSMEFLLRFSTYD